MDSKSHDGLYKVLSDIKTVKLAIIKYYNSLEESIKTIDTRDMDSYVMRITELKIPMLKKLDITIKKFGAVSSVNKLLKLVNLLYSSIDIDIDTIDVSATRASEIKKHFEYMTKLYTRYISSLKNLYNELINFICDELIKKNIEPTTVQSYFHKHPNSIDLYVNYMTIKINQPKFTSSISGLLELDKSRALTESKYITPLLTFGLTPIPESKWGTLASILELKNVAKITNSVAIKLKCCIIQIKRGVNNPLIYQLPKSGTRNQGAGPNNINFILTEHKGQARLGWDIVVAGAPFANKKVIFIESISPSLHRKLQNKYNTIINDKIFKEQFGRPGAISEIKSNNLVLNQSYINLTTDKTYKKIEVNMLILQVKELLRKKFRLYRLTKFLTERVGFSEVFEKYIDTLNIHRATKSHVAFKLFQMEDEFYTELLSSYNKLEGNVGNIMTWFDIQCPIILKTILNAGDNIFDMISEDNYIYNHVLKLS